LFKPFATKLILIQLRMIVNIRNYIRIKYMLKNQWFFKNYDKILTKIARFRVQLRLAIDGILDKRAVPTYNVAKKRRR